MGGFTGKIARFAGWVLATLLALVLGAFVAFGPLALLPGPFQLDLVQGQWLKVAGGVFALAVMSWRMAPLSNDLPFTLARGAALVRGAVIAMAMAFWPLGLLVWINGYGMHGATLHDMVVTGVEETHVRPASTPITSYRLRDLETGWTANMEIVDQHPEAAVGHCVRNGVVAGRLGLDWIGSSRRISCSARDRFRARLPPATPPDRPSPHPG